MYTSEEIGKNTWLILECGYDAIYYLEGGEKGLLIDTGVGAGNLKEYIDKNIASKPYDVLLTHGHLDHIGAILQYPKILVNEKDWEMVKNSISNEDRRHFLENMKEMSEGRVENQDSSNMILYNGYLPELVDIADGAVINLGNRELQVHATPGHTQGSICLTDSQENIAIVGDTIIYRLLLMTGPKDLHERLKIWWESTKFLYEGDYRAWYMGHCGIVPDVTRTELREIIRRLLENLSIVEMEGTSPKYVLGETQVYLGPPLSLQFTKID